MDCSVMDTPAHDVPSPYLDLDSPTGIDALGYDRAAIHTAAAERLARRAAGSRPTTTCAPPSGCCRAGWVRATSWTACAASTPRPES